MIQVFQKVSMIYNLLVVYSFTRSFIYLMLSHYLRLCTTEHDFTSLFFTIIVSLDLLGSS